MKHTLILSSALIALGLAACDNPADKTAAAKVQDKVAKVQTADAQAATRYHFTPNSKIGFVGAKLTGSHQGGFKSFTGHFTLENGKPVGNDHKVVIDMNSTFADAEKLTTHLKSGDFFDVEKYPTSTFDVTELKDGGNGSYTVAGNFTLHGVTKNITFPATVQQNGDTVKIAAKFAINRKDFGIVYPGKVDDLINDDVKIALDLEAKPGA